MVAKLCIAMARPVQHRIELTEEERAELDAACAGGEAAVPGCAAREDRALRGAGDGGHGDRGAVGHAPRGSWGSGEDGSSTIGSRD